MGLKLKGVVPRSPQSQRGQAELCLPRHLHRAMGATAGQASNPPGGKKIKEKKRDCVFGAQLYSLGPKMLEQLCFLLI